MNVKSYGLTVIKLFETDAEAICEAAKIASNTGEHVQVNCGGKIICVVFPDGSILMNNYLDKRASLWL